MSGRLEARLGGSGGTDEDTEGPNLWASFTDIMSALSLVLFFITLLSFVNNIRLAQDVRKVKRSMDQIVGVKAEIMQSIRRALEGTVPGNQIEFGPNVNIIFKENVFFDYDKVDIKPEGQRVLATLSRGLGSALEGEGLRKYIAMVVVGGHTDSTGGADYNWELSVRRAVNVVRYLHAANPALGSKYARFFAATGFSMFRPYDGGADIGKANRTAEQRSMNRRIEIQVILKDEKVMEEVNRLLKGP